MTELSYAYTGASRSRVHIAVEEIYQTRALCGVGITGTTEYRPSRVRLNAELCPNCKREAKKLGADPFALGIRHEADGP